ncbi:MAG TPA: hypothetical protein VIN34_06045 [Candidatus Limnocylindria bacterium]
MIGRSAIAITKRPRAQSSSPIGASGFAAGVVLVDGRPAAWRVDGISPTEGVDGLAVGRI